jgi:hypothetical protein
VYTSKEYVSKRECAGASKWWRWESPMKQHGEGERGGGGGGGVCVLCTGRVERVNESSMSLSERVGKWMSGRVNQWVWASETASERCAVLCCVCVCVYDAVSETALVVRGRTSRWLNAIRAMQWVWVSRSWESVVRQRVWRECNVSGRMSLSESVWVSGWVIVNDRCECISVSEWDSMSKRVGVRQHEWVS